MPVVDFEFGEDSEFDLVLDIGDGLLALQDLAEENAGVLTWNQVEE